MLLSRTADLLTQLGDAPVLKADSLRQVAAQTCIAIGERDDTLTADEAREFAGYVTHARFQLLPDVPHPIERVPATLLVDLMRNLM